MTTVTVKLQTDTERRLREQATAEGQTLETYLADMADRAADGGQQPDTLAEAMRRLTTRTPDEVLADRNAVLATARRGRPLPAGKTLFDVVEGTWPGDESDEEIRQALEKLS